MEKVVASQARRLGSGDGPAKKRRVRPNKQEWTGDLMGRRILIVDDDAMTRRSLARVLVAEGCHSELASDIEQALKLSADCREGFDAAVVDYWLANERGPELIAWLRALPEPCCALLITGTADLDVAREGIGKGADDFLLKPFTATDFLSALSRTVSRTLAWRTRLEHESSRRPDRPVAGSIALARPPRADSKKHKPQPGPMRTRLGVDAGYLLQKLARDGELTTRETQVLRLVLKGETTQDIADHLEITRRTVKYHMAKILRSLGVSSRAELMGMVFERIEE